MLATPIARQAASNTASVISCADPYAYLRFHMFWKGSPGMAPPSRKDASTKRYSNALLALSDGQMNQWTDRAERTRDGQTVGRSDSLSDRQTVCRTDRQTDGRTDRHQMCITHTLMHVCACTCTSWEAYGRTFGTSTADFCFDLQELFLTHKHLFHQQL